MSQDLSKGKIYKITNDYNDDVYVGSTCDLLTKKFSSHKRERNCANRKNSKLYSLMREIDPPTIAMAMAYLFHM